MAIDDLFADGKANAGSGVIPVSMQAFENLKDRFVILRVNANAVIGNKDSTSLVFQRQKYGPDRFSGRCISGRSKPDSGTATTIDWHHPDSRQRSFANDIAFGGRASALEIGNDGIKKTVERHLGERFAMATNP